MYPSLLTRISYQVGSPWMFDGKTFLPVTGTPIRKIACMSRLLALAEPVPLTVPILNEKSLMRDRSDIACNLRPPGASNEHRGRRIDARSVQMPRRIEPRIRDQ